MPKRLSIDFETIFLAECLGPGSEGDKTGNVTESVVEIDQCQRKYENSFSKTYISPGLKCKKARDLKFCCAWPFFKLA